jgi:hypothetical protein
MSVNLKTVLDQSYIDPNGRDKMIGDYVYDHELSNKEDAVYHNPKENKLLISYRGTANMGDAKTDLSLALGELRNTNRYDRSKATYDTAKNKYNGSKAIITGHSLGGSLASAIARDDDDIISFNKGNSLIPSSATKTKSNEKSYRIKNDIVSIIPDKNTTTINNNKYLDYLNPWWYNRMKAHSTKNIEKNNIYI